MAKPRNPKASKATKAAEDVVSLALTASEIDMDVTDGTVPKAETVLSDDFGELIDSSLITPIPEDAVNGGDPFFLTVKGPKGGRWRAGRLFGPEPVTLDWSEVSESDAVAILNDPDLATEVSAPPT